jgi:hypothetical protein
MEVDWLKKVLPAEAAAEDQTNEGQPIKAPALTADDLRNRLKFYSSDTDRSIMRGAGSPYEGVEAFWCCLAAMLPAWTKDFPLTPPQVASLLAAFDAVFDEQWKRIASQLSLAVELRYSPDSMAAVRSTLAGLAEMPAPETTQAV